MVVLSYAAEPSEAAQWARGTPGPSAGRRGGEGRHEAQAVTPGGTDTGRCLGMKTPVGPRGAGGAGLQEMRAGRLPRAGSGRAPEGGGAWGGQGGAGGAGGEAAGSALTHPPAHCTWAVTERLTT